jgi:putative molybdopterin biosynthesis protein
VRQEQFLEVLDRDEAERRWLAALALEALPSERVPIVAALGRVLARDLRSAVDVPSFDRSNLDGFAVRAEDSFGATEEVPVRLRLTGETIPTGVEPEQVVPPGGASAIATGGMLPRGADAVIGVEYTDLEAEGSVVVVRRAAVPGAAVAYAGTDIGRGETVLFQGARLTSRETGVLAAIGVDAVDVVRQPSVAVI